MAFAFEHNNDLVTTLYLTALNYNFGALSKVNVRQKACINTADLIN